MELKYDIPTYLTSAKMSSKIRVLVEGRDDRAHVSNVLAVLCPGKKIKVDMAVEIKGDGGATAKNHRAKIERAHELSKGDSQYRKLFFLCDREVRGFSVGKDLKSNIVGDHHVDGALSWTAGHSIENYFLSPGLLADGLRHLTASAFKGAAIEIFLSCFESSIRLIACLTLASVRMGNATYPCGVVGWRCISINGGDVFVNFGLINNPMIDRFRGEFEECKEIVGNSEVGVCALVCRGHTAVIILQRIFAACLYVASGGHGPEGGEYDANVFSSIDEGLVSAALSEAWIKRVGAGYAMYPSPLVESILAVS